MYLGYLSLFLANLIIGYEGFEVFVKYFLVEMFAVSPAAELAMNMAIELAKMNETVHVLPSFIQYVKDKYQDFPGDYENSSHLQRHSTGLLERKLANYLIQLAAFKCSQFNCQIASQVMVLLGYESYQIRSHRFRQKVENYLRKQRRTGGGVPPSSRASSKKKQTTDELSSATSKTDTASTGGGSTDEDMAEPLYPHFRDQTEKPTRCRFSDKYSVL